MTYRAHRNGWPGWLAASVAVSVIAASAILPLAAMGQSRNGGDRRNDNSPRRDSSPAPTRDASPAPSRNSGPAPTRDPVIINRGDSNPGPVRQSPPIDRTVGPGLRRDPVIIRPSNPTDRLSQPQPNRDVLRNDLNQQNRGTRDPFGRIGPNTTGPIRTAPLDARGMYNALTSPSRAYDPRPRTDRGYDIFTRSLEGRHFNNGIVLRSGRILRSSHFHRYFIDDYAFYPYYAPIYTPSLVYFSPYTYYVGLCPPYIVRDYTYYQPPTVVYVETPVYVNYVSRGYYDEDDASDYYLNRYRYRYDGDEVRDKGLDRAVKDIEDAFDNRDIQPLVNMTDPDTRIAVYLRGKYQYSLSANDYLDMTRDALRTTDTISFDLYRVRSRSRNVYSVSGKHVFRDRNGDKKTVYVSFVLERQDGQWTITQVGTAPDKIDDSFSDNPDK